MNVPASALTIAGSDSGGGAGIQADIKTFSALGVYATTAITAVTAQNTSEVRSIVQIPPAEISRQIYCVLEDIDLQAIKIGMLGDSKTIKTVKAALEDYPEIPVVLDPVMIAQSGKTLLQEDAVSILREELIPLATLLTPNIPEAALLLEIEETAVLKKPEFALHSLLELGSDAVLLKGGHTDSPSATDYFFDGEQQVILSRPREKTKNVHGTGCTLSAAIAAFLAQGNELLESVNLAKDYITAAIQAADQLEVGKGAGPVHHFYRTWVNSQGR